MIQKIAEEKKKRTMDRSRGLIQQNLNLLTIKSTGISGWWWYFVFLENFATAINRFDTRQNSLTNFEVEVNCQIKHLLHRNFKSCEDGPDKEGKGETPGNNEETVVDE